jgi:glycosyltransferase involved in cell wall biosynthesis
MEAVAAGLPVVAQDTPVARWQLEDQARFVESNDEAAVAAALDAAARLDGPEQRAARAALARRRSWSIIAERYYEYLRELHARRVGVRS